MAAVRALAGLIALLGVAGRAAEVDGAAVRRPRDGAIVFAGCRAVRAGPSCVLGTERRIVIWSGLPAGAEPSFASDRPLPPPAAEPAEDGRRYTLVIPAGASHIVVRGTAGGERDGAPLLHLSFHEPEPEDAVFVQAAAERRAGRLERYESLLRAAMPRLPPRARRLAQEKLLWPLILDGRGAEAAPELVRLAAESRAAGDLSEASWRGWAASVQLHSRRHDFAGAREVLALTAPAATQFGEGRIGHAHYEASLALASGDLRQALHASGLVSAWSRRLGRLASSGEAGLRSLDLRTRVLTRLGRAAEALAAGRQLAELVKKGHEPCGRADAFSDLAWIALLAPASTTPARGRELEIDRWLDEAERAAATCGDPSRRRQVGLCRAHAELARDRPDRAAAALDRAQEVSNRPHQLLEAGELELRGRVALARGRPREAEAFFTRLADRAGTTDLLEGVFRATAGRARALSAQGRTGEALDAHRRAEQLLDALAARIPLGEGRDTFLGLHDDNARRLVSLLVRLGRAGEALTAARLARRRPLATSAAVEMMSRLDPDARAQWERRLGEYLQSRARLEAGAAQAWTLAGRAHRAALDGLERERVDLRRRLDDALAALSQAVGGERRRLEDVLPGELLLLTFPSDGTSWWLLARLDGRSEAHLIDPPGAPPDDGAAARALAPVARLVRRARRLRVLPYGPFAGVDFHAASFEGAPLGERLPVAYGLDLSSAPVARPGSDLLVVADTHGNLPESRQEAREVLDRLAGEPGERHLLVGEAATFDRLLRLLPRARLFHYAGHGNTPPTADGLDAHLPLSDDGRLTAGDLLALTAAPDLVVLSACEAGQLFASGPGDGVGLARAFLLVGARAAIAPVRPVPDQLAREVARALYGEAGLRPGVDAASALAAAQSNLRRAGVAGADAFRVLVP